MQKIKTVRVKGSRIVVETAITTTRRGSLWFSYEVVGVLADLGKKRLMFPRNFVYQEGTYDTKDPNARLDTKVNSSI